MKENDKNSSSAQIIIKDNTEILDKERKKILSSFYSADNNKNINKMTVEEINFINNIKSYSLYDYLFPFHTIFKTNEKIYEHLNEYFNSNSNFYYYKRYLFLNSLASNYDFNKYKTTQTLNKLKKLENKYFYINSTFLLFGSILSLYSANKRNFLNLYLGVSVLFNSKIYSTMLINDEFNEILSTMKYNGKKFQDEEMLLERDLLDETIIKDSRCHLYYYGIY